MRYVNMSVEGEKSGSKPISNEDKKRFEDLFNLLDTNKDGTVDIQELTAVTCLSSHRPGVMTTPRTRTDSATGMMSFPSVSDTSPPGIRSRLLLVPVQIRLVGIQLQSVG